MVQLRSGSEWIQNPIDPILWVRGPGVEAILGRRCHVSTGIDPNTDATVQSCRQMRRTRPRVPKTFLGPPPAAGLQQQPWRPFLKDGSKPPATGPMVRQFKNIGRGFIFDFRNHRFGVCITRQSESSTMNNDFQSKRSMVSISGHKIFWWPQRFES